MGDSLTLFGAVGSVLIAAGVILANASKSPAPASGLDDLSAKGGAFAMPLDDDCDQTWRGDDEHYSHGQHLRTASSPQGNDDGDGEQAVVLELQPVSEHAERSTVQQ